MSATVIDEIEVTTVRVVIKFMATLAISTIKNSKFPVYINTDPESPVQVSNPFETIVIADDYNSISKVLILTWNEGALLPDTDYKIVLTGLEQPDGTVLDNAEVEFTTPTSVTPTISELPTEATPVSIVDYSLVSDAFVTSVISPDNVSFSVTSTDPEDGEYYIEEDYMNGRVTIKFSSRPSLAYVNSDYIRVQRKAIQRAPARWETVDVRISLDTNRSWIYVDFPALDHYPEAATPLETDDAIYTTSGYQYFEPNYKYRIIVSKDLSN